jgi:putative endonuclease
MHWSSLNPRTWIASLTKPSSQGELAPHFLLGQRGEHLAADYLQCLGYTLVVSNFTLPVGRNLRGVLVQAEIDLIAYEASTLCFIEVKTRASDWFAAPAANVDLRKQRQIARIARIYRRMFDLTGEPYRYDVVSVVLPPEDESGKTPPPRLELLRNFWRDDKFRKRRWTDPPDGY